jgi:hypothetical protein
MLYQLEDSAAEYVIENREFSESLLKSNIKTAFILSQSWCPQWIGMKGYLKSICENNSEIDIYVLEYDKKPYFTNFMHMKERHWGNFYVPYIRFYKNGKFLSDANLIPKDEFIARFK